MVSKIRKRRRQRQKQYVETQKEAKTQCQQLEDGDECMKLGPTKVRDQ